MRKKWSQLARAEVIFSAKLNKILCRRMGATRGALTWKHAAAAGCAAGTQRRRSVEAVTRSMSAAACASEWARGTRAFPRQAAKWRPAVQPICRDIIVREIRD